MVPVNRLTAEERALLQRKVVGWQEAADASRSERASRGASSSPVAVAQAFDLWSLRPDLFALPRSARELAEVEAVAATWQRLRANWRAPGGAASR